MSRIQIEEISDEPSPAFILMGRILIGVMTLLLVIIPWSECYSTLDSFPHGQDTEFGILAFFAILGFILLFVRATRDQLRNLLAAFRDLLLSIIPLAMSLLPDYRHGRALTNLPPPPPPDSPLEIYNLPLQI